MWAYTPWSKIETTTLLHGAFELVRVGYGDADHDGGPRPFLLVQEVAAYTELGVIGLPALVIAVKAVLESLRSSFSAHLELVYGSG